MLAETTPTAMFCWYGAEALASSDASASSYSAPENIRVLRIIETELKLREIKRQVLFAYMMIVADDATLEQAPERIEVLGMHFAAYIFASGVLHCIVLITESGEIAVSGVLVGCDQTYPIAHGFADETIERCRIGMFDHLTDYVTLSADSTFNRGLIATEPALTALLIPMAILVFTAHIGFVHFDDTHELLKIRIMHRGAQAVAHEPCCSIRAGADHSMNLQCADTFLAGQHQVQDFEPDEKLIVGILENGSNVQREAIGKRTAFVALPRPRALGLVKLLIAATRASRTSGPAALHEIALAGIFVGKKPIKVGNGHLPDKFGFALFNFFVHERRVA